MLSLDSGGPKTVAEYHREVLLFPELELGAGNDDIVSEIYPAGVGNHHHSDGVYIDANAPTIIMRGVDE